MLPDMTAPGLGTIAIAGVLLIVALLYQLLARALDLFPPEGRDQDPETQDDFHISLQRNRVTQERMGR